MGNPLDPDVLFGPLADAEQLKKVMQYVNMASRMAQLYAMVVSDSIGWHRWQRLLLPADHTNAKQ